MAPNSSVGRPLADRVHATISDQHLGRVDRLSGFEIELARTDSRPGALLVPLDRGARLARTLA